MNKLKNSSLGSLIITTVSFFSIMVVFTQIDAYIPILLAIFSGLIFGIKLRFSQKDCLLSNLSKSTMSVISGSLILLSFILFSTLVIRKFTGPEIVFSSNQVLSGVLSNFQPLLGYLLVIIGSYILFINIGFSEFKGNSESLTLSIQENEASSSSVLLLITIISILSSLGLNRLINLFKEFYWTQSSLAGFVSGTTVLGLYLIFREVWKVLKIRKFISRPSLQFYSNLSILESFFRWFLLPIIFLGISLQPFLPKKNFTFLTVFSTVTARNILLGFLVLLVSVLSLYKILKLLINLENPIKSLKINFLSIVVLLLAVSLLKIPLSQFVSTLPKSLSLVSATNEAGLNSLILMFFTLSVFVSQLVCSMISFIEKIGFIENGFEEVNLISTSLFILAVGGFLYTLSPWVLFPLVTASVFCYDLTMFEAILKLEVGVQGASINHQINKIFKIFKNSFISFLTASTIFVLINSYSESLLISKNSGPALIVVSIALLTIIWFNFKPQEV